MSDEKDYQRDGDKLLGAIDERTKTMAGQVTTLIEQSSNTAELVAIHIDRHRQREKWFKKTSLAVGTILATIIGWEHIVSFFKYLRGN